jgi:pimeloyl-ACP methyl ester carboxylesterase
LDARCLPTPASRSSCPFGRAALKDSLHPIMPTHKETGIYEEAVSHSRSSRLPTITANGAELYYEVRGSGPSVLLIAGGGLDGGTFGGLATILAREFTVVVYDRRGLSRSSRPTGWRQTSISEQADDAGDLLQALHIAPAAIVGNSLGALIALELLLRHPDEVRGASLLDTGPVDAAIHNRRERMPMPDAVRVALAGGGDEAQKAGFEALLRFLGIWDVMDPASRRRIVGNAEVFFNYETPLLSSYRPDEVRLQANRVPVQVGAGEGTPRLMREMAEWLASRLTVAVETIPGGHVGYVEHPAEVANAIKPFLHRVTAGHSSLPAPGSP